MSDSKRAERGEVVWLRPWKTGEPNKLGLALFLDSDENFFLMCESDTRLAGHLDVVLPPGHAGIPYALAIMTHVGAWVEFGRVCSIPVGRLSEAECVEIENARAGQRPQVLKSGRLLRDPALEPRWALIERKARAFQEAVAPIKKPSSEVQTQNEFDDQFARLVVQFLLSDETTESRRLVKDGLETYYQSIENHPEWDRDPLRWYEIDKIENHIRIPSLVSA